jgi:hypothetical protein
MPDISKADSFSKQAKRKAPKFYALTRGMKHFRRFVVQRGEGIDYWRLTGEVMGDGTGNDPNSGA